MRFTNAYAAAPVCSPTRAALMTGKYPARLHLTDFIKGGSFPDSLLIQPEWQKFLPLEEITLAEVFQNRGYRTALFGKWHLSREKMPPVSEFHNPDKQGFDEYLITYKPRKGRTDPSHDPHNVDSITSRSIRFMNENRDKSFFLVVSHNSIHDPLMEDPLSVKQYSSGYSETGYRVDPRLGAMVSRLDSGVGRLLDAIDKFGLKGNTLVLFCSDNGGKASYASQHPFRKGKGWLYEGGIRVPMIACWPGRIKPGGKNPVFTSTIDLFPTLLELSGRGSEENPEELYEIDGKSMAAAMLGSGEFLNRTLFWHYPHYHGGSGMKPASALRRDNYKLIEWHEALLRGRHAWELYDLDKDPGETVDLSLSMPEILDELRTELHRWRREVDAQMPGLGSQACNDQR
jgi:uncharacterized sulfatase